jgi:hypothetical protein
VFERSGGGLIGEKFEDDTFLKGGGVEIISGAATNDYPCHAVYPHYSDNFEDGLLGAHVTYPVYPHNRDKPEDTLLGAHVTYPFFERSGGGLIGEKLNDGTLVKGGGCEAVASVGANGRRPEERVLGANMTHPKSKRTSGGMIVMDFKNDSMIEDCSRCITANNASIAHGATSLKPGCAEFVSKLVSDDSPMHPNLLAGSNMSKLTTNTGTRFPSKSPADLELDLNNSLALKKIEDDKQMALLVAAFVSLPCEAIIHAMRAATTPLVMNSGPPMQTCTGCGSSL